MEELLTQILESGEFKPLRFTVYNYLEEEERYQQNLSKFGYDSSYEDLEGKMLQMDNDTANAFKHYIEDDIQKGSVVVNICVLKDSNYITVVKPKSVELRTILTNSQS